MLATIRDNKHIYIDQLTEGAENAIVDWFSVRDPSFYKSGGSANWDGIYRRYNTQHQRLCLPFLNELKLCCKEHNIPLEIKDERPAPKYPAPRKDQITNTFIEGISLESYQLRALHAACEHEIGIFSATTGSGKCLGKNTPVMMYNGSTKLVQDIIIGDLLMGDDNTPREVLSLCRGREPLYRVKQKNGNDYVVNESHILSLKRTRRREDDPKAGKIEDISVKDYLKSNKFYKHITKGYKVPIDFGNEEVPFDPYLLGLWLGDGISTDLQICVGEEDKEILEYLNHFCDKSDLQLVKYPDEREKADIYALRLYEGVHRPAWSLPFSENHLKREFKDYDLFRNKHVPDVFKKSSQNDRLRLLAGFIDSDGEVDNKVATIIHRPGRITDDMIFVARSLGFRVSANPTQKKCTTTGYVGDYIRIVISGHTDRIPTILSRKKMASRESKKDPLMYGIEIESIGEGEYFGFQINGNKRFLLGDFTVTHNTEVMCGLVKMFRCPTIIITEQIVVLEQIIKRLSMRNVVHKNDIGMFCFGKMPDNNLVIVGSIQSISTPTKPKREDVKVKGKRVLKQSMEWIQKEIEWKENGKPDEEIPHLRRALPSAAIEALTRDPDYLHEMDEQYIGLLVDYCNQLEFERRMKWYKTRIKKAKAIQAMIKDKCELLIIDECDLATTQQYARLFKFIYTGRRRCGVTGTPFDKAKPVQNMFLKEHLGSIVSVARRDEVEKAGRIVPVKFTMIAVGADGDKEDSRAYDIALKEEMIENERFHRIIAKLVKQYKDEGTLILVDTSPIQPLGEALEAIIPNSKFIFGKTKPKERNKILGEFESRELKCLIGSKILKRGLDLKGGVENLIIVGGGAKWSDFEQKIGRALRLNKSGKSRVFGFFFLNNKYLYKHSRENLKAIVSMGYTTKVLVNGKILDGQKFIKSRFRIPKF